MKQHEKIRIGGIFNRMTSLVAMSLVGLVVLFSIVLILWLHSSGLVIDIYADSTQAGMLYSEGYLDILDSRSQMDHFFQYRDQESYGLAMQRLGDAREKLEQLRGASPEPNRRQIIDLEMMIETCMDTNARARSLLNTGEGYQAILDAKHKYELLEMIYAEGWNDRLQLLSDAQSEANQKRRAANNLTLTAILLALGVAMLIAAFVLGRIRRTIRTLNSYAHTFSEGNLDVPRMTVRDDGDFKPMWDALNALVDQVRHNVIEREERKNMELELAQQTLQKLRIETQLRTSQIKELQSGLNPHFLFNTLNLIACTAYLEDAHKTRRLMEALSSLLRHTIDHPSVLVSVAREMSTLEQYILIQQERFEGRIEFQVEVDEAILEDFIPAITLQPIVENSLIHGLNDKPGRGLVSVSLYPSADQLCVSVRDNGCGMTERKIEQVLQGKTTSYEHYGLPAVFERVRLIYGAEHSRIRIESEPGEWTLVHLEFPRQPLNGGSP